MRISRIFRKYSRILLLVFMSLLLVVFLLGDVIGRARYNQRARDLEIGQAFGEPVYASQTRSAQDDFALARQLRVATPDLWIEARSPQERDLVMFLLLEEARRTGVRIGRDEIIAALRQDPQAASVLSSIRDATGRSLNSIYASVARVSAVMWLAGRQLAAATPVSLPQLEQAYRDQSQEAHVLVSIIDPEALLGHVARPTEEELQTHFDEAKDRETAHSEEELVFGYRLPNRIQLEYLTVDPVEMRELVRVREKEVLRYYRDNQHKYTKTVEDDSPFTLEQQQPQTVPMEYEEAKKQVKEDYRAAKAIEEAQRLVNDIEHEARLPWNIAALGENEERRRPPDDQIVSFTELQKRFSDRGPVIYRKTELVTQRELYDEPGFGQAGQTAADQRRILAPALAFRVEGLANPNSNDRAPTLRLNEPGPVVVETRKTGADPRAVPYQSYLFRVTRVEPAGPPASLDDVRAEALDNVKQIKAFELAGQHARALAEQARQVGLKQAVAKAADLRVLLGETEPPPATQPATEPASQPAESGRYVNMLGPFEPERFMRRPSRLTYAGTEQLEARSLHEKVFALAEAGTEQASEEHRVVLVPVANNRRGVAAETLEFQPVWVVAELLDITPIYRGEFEMVREQLEQRVAWARRQTFITAWFKADNIIRRTGFVPAAALQP